MLLSHSTERASGMNEKQKQLFGCGLLHISVRYCKLVIHLVKLENVSSFYKANCSFTRFTRLATAVCKYFARQIHFEAGY